MHINLTPTPAEVSAVDDKVFHTLQAQLAAQGIDLHRVTGSLGREAFAVNVRGAARPYGVTLDTLPQVQAYARSVQLIESASLKSTGGVQC